MITCTTVLGGGGHDIYYRLKMKNNKKNTNMQNRDIGEKKMNNRICVYTETSINLYSGSIMMLLWWILIDTWSYMYSFDTFIWTIQIRIGWIILSTKRYLHMNGENKKKVHRVNHNPMTQSLVFIIINIYRNKQIITSRKERKMKR